MRTRRRQVISSTDSWVEQPLLRFKTPTERSREALKDLLENLTPTAFHVRRGLPYNLRNISDRGDLAKILASLWSSIRRDHEKTLQFARELGANFEFVGGPSSNYPGAFELLTKLFQPTKGGAIYYGRMICRLGEREYALWIDD